MWSIFSPETYLYRDGIGVNKDSLMSLNAIFMLQVDFAAFRTSYKWKAYLTCECILTIAFCLFCLSMLLFKDYYSNVHYMVSNV